MASPKTLALRRDPEPATCRSCAAFLPGSDPGICSRCFTREKNIAETGRPDMRRVWLIPRRERKRLTGAKR